MTNEKIVRVIGIADGRPSPHDNRFVLEWNPHTYFGICEISTTNDRAKAKRFSDMRSVHSEWAAISKIQPARPDGKPNRPLSGLSIDILPAVESQ